MAEYTVTLDGTGTAVERDVLMASVDLNLVANGLDTLSVDVDSEDGSITPQPHEEIRFNEDGVPIFGGIITEAEEAGFGDITGDSIVTRVSATGFAIYLSYRYVTATFAAGTLKSMWTTLLTYVSQFGITLHASQVAGPAMPEMKFTRTRVDEVANRLCEMAGHTYRVAPDKVFRSQQVGVESAPFSLLNTGPVRQQGDVEVAHTINDKYATNIILVVSGAGPSTSTETFTADGSPTATYVTKYPASQNINTVWPNVLLVDGNRIGPVGWGPSQLPGAHWYWDFANHSLVHTGGAYVPSAGAVIEVTYEIAYPFEVEVAASPDDGPQIILDVPEAMSLTAAQAYAAALLAERSAVTTRVQYTTRTSGLRPGMRQTVTLPTRHVDAQVLITDVRASTDPNSDRSYLLYGVTGITGALVHSQWQQPYKDWLKQGGSRVGTGITSGTHNPDILLVAVVTLTNAQIKAAADTPVLLVYPMAPDTRVKPIAASLRLSFASGGYSVNPTYAGLDIICGGKRMSCGWYNDASSGASAFTELFGAHDLVADLPVPAMDTIEGLQGSPATSPANQHYIMGEDVASLPDAADVDDAGLYLSLRNNGAGPFTGGDPDNALKVTVYYVLEDISVPAATPSACPTTLWSDDFESGAALSSDYTNISDLVKTAGVGNGGTQGIEGSGTDSDKFYAEMTKDVNAATRVGCYTLDYKCSQALWTSGGGSAGHYLVEVRDANGVVHFGIYSGGGFPGSPAFGDISLYTTGNGDTDVTGVYSNNTWFELRVEWELSSVSGGARQPDGWVRVYKDGVQIINQTGLTFGNYNAITNPNNFWDCVHLAPQGAGDNLVVGTV